MNETLTRLLINTIQEGPNELGADLETGSHHRNNAAAAEFAKNYPNLVAWMNRVVNEATHLEEKLNAPHPDSPDKD